MKKRKEKPLLNISTTELWYSELTFNKEKIPYGGGIFEHRFKLQSLNLCSKITPAQ